jgi:hypothetical protein
MKRRQSILNNIIHTTSSPCGERLLSRGRGLNRLTLRFLANTFALLKVNNCHSEDEVRRISISWLAGAKPCDSSLRSERQTLCHTALDAVSQELSLSLITYQDCFVFLGLLTPHPSPLPKERENPVTNVTPLSQCKTWRTSPC